MFIDSHCHLEAAEKEGLEISKIVGNAQKKGVGLILANGIDSKTNEQALNYSRNFKEIKVALGLYPENAVELSDSDLEENLSFIRQKVLENKKVIAIGEVGIDFKFTGDEEIRERQIEIFKKIVELGKELDIPLIIHSRKAEKECIEILENFKAKKVLMHCFSGKLSLVKRIFENGWFLSIPTCVKNSEQFQKVVEITPIENLLCETDSPFLHPDKGFPNEPANVVESYKKIAEIKDLTLKEVENKIEENFKKLFMVA